MDSQQRGAELNKMSGLLFDAVAVKWQAALVLEIVAGLIGALLALSNPEGRLGLAVTILGFACLAIAYVLRIWAEAQYDTAETMRRQSFLTEALGRKVSDWQFMRWCQRVGKRIREAARQAPRDPTYYFTQKPVGPQRLAEMTTESAFFTHRQYCMLRERILVIVIVVSALTFFFLTLPFLVSDGNDERLGRILYALLPLAFALDLVGWWFRLGRTTTNIDAVLQSLENLRTTGTADDDQVLRVVAEYNSQVANGFPLPNWLFQRWHDEIQSEWEEYLRSITGRASTAAPAG